MNKLGQNLVSLFQNAFYNTLRLILSLVLNQCIKFVKRVQLNLTCNSDEEVYHQLQQVAYYNQNFSDFMTDLSTSPKEHRSDVFDELPFQAQSVLSSFKQNVFKPHQQNQGETHEDSSNKFSQNLLNWARQNHVDHVSFLCFPYNSTMCEKQESLIDIRYFYDSGFKQQEKLLLNNQFLLKGETDGSSFPSGGLRTTHRARAYTIRDPHSDIFIRRKNKVMYIPSLLITHHGQGLDDKTLFRKSELVMKRNALALLKSLGKNAKQIFLALGLEQQFFVVPKSAYHKRQDLMFTGRTLVGKVGAKNQQFSDHYFAKIPRQIEDILKQVQQQLLQIGIPFKTKHNEVANNQFEFSSIFCDAGRAIDQNLIAMQILKQLFDRRGYTVLLHQKPFLELNGSGKHANWSINYVDQSNKMKNLFSVPKQQSDVSLFRLFVLLTLSAIQKNNPLYFASIARPGNEVRLGGHEAPPRIISAYLGQTVSAVVDGRPAPVKANLKDKLFFLQEDVFQQDTDRNRTSPFAYTGHKFEFRALGSSQNAAWPMAVICATLAQQFSIAQKKIKEGGYTIDTLIEELLHETRAVRFEDNGYSAEWGEQAKKRGLYVNESFNELFDRITQEVGVFVEVGACSQSEIQAKCQVLRQEYQKIAETEAKALHNLALKKIIPRGLKYLQILQKRKDNTNGSKAEKGIFSSLIGLTRQTIEQMFNFVFKKVAPGSMENLQKYQKRKHAKKKHIQSYKDNLSDLIDEALEQLEQLNLLLNRCSNYSEAAELRQKTINIGEMLGQLCSYLQKDQEFPDLQDFLLK